MEIKKYIEFIREWGTDANKGQIKVSDSMIDEIDLSDGNNIDDGISDIENQLEIMFTGVDMSESLSVKSDADPYGEEDWEGNLPEKDFLNWKGTLWDWLMQLGDEYYIELLRSLYGAEKFNGERIIEDIIEGLENDDNMTLDGKQIAAISKAAHEELRKYIDQYRDDDEDGEKKFPDPDEYYDRKKLEEYEKENEEINNDKLIGKTAILIDQKKAHFMRDKNNWIYNADTAHNIGWGFIINGVEKINGEKDWDDTIVITSAINNPNMYKLSNFKIVNTPEPKIIYSEIDPYGEEDWNDDNIKLLER